MSPSSNISITKHFGERQDLLDLDWKSAALEFSFKTAPLGSFWAFSHGFWFATPTKTVFKNILVKGASFGAFGAAYQGTAVISAHIRGKNDSFNQAIGGFVAGNLAGLARSSLRHAMGYGTVLACASFFVTEAGSEHYYRLTTKGDLMPNFLKVKNDPFVSRLEKEE